MRRLPFIVTGSVVIERDKVSFESFTSSRVQLKELLQYQPVPLVGIYEYEAGSHADANVSGVGIIAPGMRSKKIPQHFDLQWTDSRGRSDKIESALCH